MTWLYILRLVHSVSSALNMLSNFLALVKASEPDSQLSHQLLQATHLQDKMLPFFALPQNLV